MTQNKAITNIYIRLDKKYKECRKRARNVKKWNRIGKYNKDADRMMRKGAWKSPTFCIDVCNVDYMEIPRGDIPDFPLP